MNTLKKFISYYRPYRAVFYFDLFCAAVISVVDLAITRSFCVVSQKHFLPGTKARF